MPDLEKVIKGLEMCIKDIECTGCPYEGECFDAIDDRQFGESMMTDALALLKEQEALLNKAYELLDDMDLDFFCEDLICNDGWCDDHCTTNGTTPECIERWLRKQISEGG